jgi:hypothetical protein
LVRWSQPRLPRTGAPKLTWPSSPARPLMGAIDFPRRPTPAAGHRDHAKGTDGSPMLAKMASHWRTFQRLAEDLVFSEATKLIRQLQRSPAVQRGIKIGLDVIVGAVADPPAEITAGRPVTRTSVPTAHRARKLVYSPDLDGRADPGEVVWTWVTYEEDPTRGKDRPVLVVGRDHATLLGLMLSSQERHAADRSWLSIGSGSWDGEGRASWVRLDRVLDVPEESIRREGAILDRPIFDVVAARLRRDYSWS